MVGPADANHARMAFDPRRFFNIELAAVVTIILSVALVAYIVLFLWMDAGNTFHEARGLSR
jgi:hypothetical protein